MHKEYIDSNFDKKGIVNHFNEFVKRQYYRESEGDMLTFADFMNNDLTQFEFN
jgi:hypothetical protein